MTSKALATFAAVSTMLLLASLAAQAAASGEAFLWLRFVESDDSLADSGPQGLRGSYMPSDNPDNDTPETKDPARYRGSSPFGKTLKFFRDLRSSASLQGLKMPEKAKSLYLRAVLKPSENRQAAILSTLDEASKGGFALVLREAKEFSTEWSFVAGDGRSFHSASFQSAPSIRQWTTVELLFDEGKLLLKIDGSKAGEETMACDGIAPGSGVVMIGNALLKKPDAERPSPCPFDGEISEILAAPEYLPPENQSKAARKQSMEVLCEPVDGSEGVFGKKTFHTVRGSPSPLSFLFCGDPKLGSSFALDVELPAELRIVEAFQANPDMEDKVFQAEKTPFSLDGKPCVRWRFKDLGIGLGAMKAFRTGSRVSLAIDCDETAQESSWLRWSFSSAGESLGSGSMEIRFLALPQAQPKGRFHYVSYLPQFETAFHERSLFQNVMEPYRRAGLTARGRFKPEDARRLALDEILRKEGFELYEISIWDGPLRRRNADAPVAEAATVADGSKSPNLFCPSEVLGSAAFKEAYQAWLRGKFAASGSSWVALDYEPWSFPDRICFCPRCLAAFKASFNLKDELSAQLIKEKFKTEWANFWKERSFSVIRMMAETSRKIVPGVKIVDYTYCCDYDSKDAMARFLWSCPKDPRQVEKAVDESMLSIYHLDGKAAFDAVERSRKALRKDISAIVLLARSNAHTGSYTKPEEALSPERIEQKALLCAALGIKTVAIWPGNDIDAAYLEALGNACRLARAREAYYLDGARDDASFCVSSKTAKERDFAWTVWKAKDGSRLLSLFNFGKEPVEFNISLPEGVQGAVGQDGTKLLGRSVSTLVRPNGFSLLETLKAE